MGEQYTNREAYFLLNRVAEQLWRVSNNLQNDDLYSKQQAAEELDKMFTKVMGKVEEYIEFDLIDVNKSA